MAVKRQRRQDSQGAYNQQQGNPAGDTSSIQSYKVVCKGGLVLNESVINHTDGEALTLQNYEPNVLGGYSKILGFTKYDSNFVPGSAGADTGSIIGVYVFKSGSEVIACRGNRVSKSSGSGWTHLNAASASTDAVKYRFTRFNWTGTEKIAFTDETNYAATYDGTTFTRLNGAGAPTNPKYCAAHRGRLFLAGYTSNSGALTYTKANDETDFSAAGGAAEIVVGDTIVGLQPFRENLIIFCERSIWNLAGINPSGPEQFNLTPITQDLGCAHADTIQEFGGDVLFLAHDGVRTIAGTERIGDIELGSISRNIQDPVSTIHTYTNVCSQVIDEKSQYRIYFSNVGTTTALSEGILGAIRRNDPANDVQGNSQTGTWEWGKTKGYKAIVAHHHDIGSTTYSVFANENSYVYRNENGNNLDGSSIESIYETPDLDLGDVAIRKTLHKVRLYYKLGGTTSILMYVYYDFGDSNIAQPAVYTFTSGSTTSVYGSAVYGTSAYGTMLPPTDRKNTEGSGFTIKLKFVTTDTNPSHTIHGFVLEVVPGGRN